MRSFSSETLEQRQSYNDAVPSAHEPCSKDTSYLSPKPTPNLGHQLLATSLGCLNGLIFGLHVGYLSVGLDSLQAEGDQGKIGFLVTNFQTKLFGTALTFSGIFGSVAAGYVAKHFGRKRSSIATLVPHVLSWALIAVSQNFAMILAAHIIAGLAEGVRETTTRLYIGEAAHPKYRGQFLSAITSCEVGSTLISFLAALYLNWQYLAVFNAVLPLLLLPIYVKLPETYAWLITQGRLSDARQAMQWLYGDDYDCEDEFNEQVKHQTPTSTAISTGSFKDVLRLEYVKPIFVLSVLTILRQYSGGSVISMYMSQIFRASRSTLAPEYAVIVVEGAQFIILFLAGYLFDKVGRKKVVFVSGIIMGSANAAMAGYLYLDETLTLQYISQRLDWMPVCCLAASLIGYSLGIGPVLNVVVIEIMPTQIRDVVGGFLSALNSACIALSVASLHFFFEWIQPSGTFWVFAGCCFALVAIFQSQMPETKGEGLDQIHMERTKAKGVSAEDGERPLRI